MSRLSDKVVIVTGASSGIGHATARELGKRRAKVVCAARRADRLDALAKAIRDEGGHALSIECDVTDRGSVNDMVETAVATFGAVDCLINNAGIMPLSFMDACAVEDWDAMVDVNIKGVLYGVAAVLPSMIERQSGHILNVSSVAGRRVMPGAAVYCGTKHAVHAITEGLRQEVAEHNIRVTTIAPGYVVTELQSAVKDQRILKRWEEAMEKGDMEPLQSEDIATVIVQSMETDPRVSYNEVLIRPTKQQV